MTGLVSHRKVLEREEDEAWEKIAKEVKIGSVVQAKIVKRISFGFFLSLGGAEGLLHNNDISYMRQNSELRKKNVFGNYN